MILFSSRTVNLDWQTRFMNLLCSNFTFAKGYNPNQPDTIIEVLNHFSFWRDYRNAVGKLAILVECNDILLV